VRLLTLALACVACVGSSAGAASASPATSAAGVSGKLHLHKRTIAAGVATGQPQPHWVCPEGACEAIAAPTPVQTADGFVSARSGRLLEGSGERGGYDPADLRAAYKIPATGATGETIAVIDAFGYPDAESDLATYRSRYGLPACTTKNGCFQKVNEHGEEGSYPAAEANWDGEAALDEDMVSAACPECHILLVEGSGERPAELGESVNTAARLGATIISNSYGYPEDYVALCGKAHCTQYEKDYEHPGTLILASAGDSGYEDAYFEIGLQTNFPASSPSVVAVGGTALSKDPSSSRGWQESVWNEPELEIGTGSGCSSAESKPAWQSDTGCSKRTDNDVAAVAAVETGVSVRIEHSWQVYGGTSVASPLVAGIMAHASSAERALGADAFYKEPSSLFDVTEGENWDPLSSTSSECAPNEYLCNGEIGYDGPTGLGTPNGVPGGAAPEAPTVTKVTPKKGPAGGGTEVTITGTGFTGVKEVRFGTTTSKKVTVSSTTSILAESPAGTGTVDVTVTTAGGTSALSANDHFKYKKAKKA
jgi:hypothetical protein